ncbi:MAG: hypothetical protein GXX10_10415 [Clostridiaceae bacterium]|nr:hypothetical protein [Clostridiaceae bacterium]
MIEIIDNAIQLMVLVCCVIYVTILSLRHKGQVWFLLTCFYGSFALGMIHWLLFIVLYNDTPKISTVSDLSWLAGVLFLLVIQNTLRLPGESTYRPLMAWAAPAFSTIMCLFFFQWGDYFLNILYAVLMGACGYNALRGFMLSRRKRDNTGKRHYFHIVVLAFILVEYCLWVSSCFWGELDHLTPYFFFDFLLTFTFFTFLPTLKKVMEE